MMLNKQVVTGLIRWYSECKRDLPWRDTRDAYVIWLSEILLQQTRVEQGMPYFHKFLKRFPSVKDLAKASEEEVMKLWEGLGYYSRARNLHKCAKIIVDQFQGDFPSTYPEIVSLPGIGPYTASAIGSFAFGLFTPVLDGNVIRVMSRVLRCETPIELRSTQKQMMASLQHGIEFTAPDMFNQAMMELGSLVCTPKKPHCSECPLQKVCQGCLHEDMERFPIKKNKRKQAVRKVQWKAILTRKGWVVEQGFEGAIWKNMWIFPGEVFSESGSAIKTLDTKIGKALEEVEPKDVIELSHQLSHRKLNIEVKLYEIEHMDGGALLEKGMAVPVPVKHAFLAFADRGSLDVRLLPF